MRASNKASRFDFIETAIPSVCIVDKKPLRDERGFFSRFYCHDEFDNAGISFEIAQINHSFSSERGILRGLHFQKPPAMEKKIVTCVQGRVFDVAVDIRKGSPTFLDWVGVELSAENQRSLVVPEGFAHGFITLSTHSEILYLVSKNFTPELENGLNPLDPEISIKWPVDVSIISEKDKNRPFISNMNFIGIEV